MKIVRKIEIDYGHTLPRHFGFCNQIHGHRGVIECVFEGIVKDEIEDSENGMVMDFAICKKIMMEEIHAVLDHGFALWKEAKYDVVNIGGKEISTLEFISARNTKIVLLDQPPTAEVLGIYFFEKITLRLEKQDHAVRLVELIWHETPNNKAIIKYGDMLYGS